MYRNIVGTVAIVGGIGFVVHDASAQAQYCTQTGSFYEFVRAQGITWDRAKEEAESRLHLGIHGHLTAILSAEENDCVCSLLDSNDVVWLGGFQFPGAPEPMAGWEWITGEPLSPFNPNWASGEPNQFEDLEEDHLEMWGGQGRHCKWNDRDQFEGGATGYIVEYPARCGVRDVFVRSCGSCSSVARSAGDTFPPAGLDQFSTGASFTVVMLDGTMLEVAGLRDERTVVGRSDPFFEDDPEDDGVTISAGGQPPYPDTAAMAPDPCVVPAGFPENAPGGLDEPRGCQTSSDTRRP